MGGQVRGRVRQCEVRERRQGRPKDHIDQATVFKYEHVGHRQRKSGKGSAPAAVADAPRVSPGHTGNDRW
eukprot:13406826-Alexandrium_andersonii.AAC.1